MVWGPTPAARLTPVEATTYFGGRQGAWSLLASDCARAEGSSIINGLGPHPQTSRSVGKRLRAG